MPSLRILSGVVAFAALIACERNPRVDVDSARPDTMPPPVPGIAPAGSTGAQTPDTTRPAEPPGRRRSAAADFEPAPGSKLDGEADLQELDTGVRIRVDVEDAPSGAKAIHVHEKGDCSDIKKLSMGSHFNPAAKAHGLPQSAERHAGDLGNIAIGRNGKGTLDILVPNVNLKDGDPMSILGRSLVIDQGEDVGTQPSGGAGTPMACAVIRADQNQ